MPWEAIAPAGAAFALVAAVVLFGAAHPVPARPRLQRLTRSGVPRMLRYIALLGAGGYLVLLLVVLVFHVGLLGDSRALPDAARRSPFLLAVATPVFVALTWLEGRLRG